MAPRWAEIQSALVMSDVQDDKPGSRVDGVVGSFREPAGRVYVRALKGHGEKLTELLSAYASMNRDERVIRARKEAHSGALQALMEGAEVMGGRIGVFLSCWEGNARAIQARKEYCLRNCVYTLQTRTSEDKWRRKYERADVARIKLERQVELLEHLNEKGSTQAEAAMADQNAERRGEQQLIGAVGMVRAASQQLREYCLQCLRSMQATWRRAQRYQMVCLRVGLLLRAQLAPNTAASGVVRVVQCLRRWSDSRRQANLSKGLYTLLAKGVRDSLRGCRGFGFDRWVDACNSTAKLATALAGWRLREVGRGWKQWRAKAQEKREQRLRIGQMLLQMIAGRIGRALRSWRAALPRYDPGLKAVDRVLGYWGKTSSGAAFLRWFEHARESKRAERCLQKAALNSLFREVSSAFFSWRERAGESKAEKNTVGRAMKRFLNRQLSMAFEKWQTASAQMKAQLKNLRRAVASLVLNSLVHALQSWKIVTAQAKHTRNTAASALKRMQNRLCGAAYLKWLEYTIHTRSAETTLKRAVIKIIHRKIYQVFQKWREAAEGMSVDAKRRAILLRQAAMGFRNRQLSLSFWKWRDSYAVRLRAQLAVRHMRVGKKASVFLAWLNHVVEQRQDSTYDESRLFIAAMRWKDFRYKAAVKILRLLAAQAQTWRVSTKAGEAMLRQHLYRGWGRWVETYMGEIASLGLLSKAVARIMRRQLTGAYHCWHQGATQAREAKQAASQAANRFMRRQLAGAYHCWHQVATQAREAKQAASQAARHLGNRQLAGAFRAWLAKHREATKQGALLARCLAKAVLGALDRAFRQWGETARNASYAACTMRNAAKRMTDRGLGMALGGWVSWHREVLRERGIAHSAAIRMKQRTLSMSWAKWQHTASTGNQESRLMRKGSARFRLGHVAVAWNAWVVLTQETKRIVKFVTDAVIRMILRTVAAAWSQWRGIAVQSHIAMGQGQQAFSHMKQMKLAAGFATWRDRTEEYKWQAALMGKYVAAMMWGKQRRAWATWREVDGRQSVASAAYRKWSKSCCGKALRSLRGWIHNGDRRQHHYAKAIRWMYEKQLRLGIYKFERAVAKSRLRVKATERSRDGDVACLIRNFLCGMTPVRYI